MLADTSFLIDLMRNDPKALEKAKELEDSGVAILVGALSVFELYVGVSLSRKSQEEKLKITGALSALAQLPLDHQSAASGGEIYGQKSKKGSNMDPGDAMLAGISKAHGETILTRNLKHFSGIPGLKTKTY
ncbi:MAG: PIN domain-containing protein [Nitrososphaerales archaeon]